MRFPSLSSLRIRNIGQLDREFERLLDHCPALTSLSLVPDYSRSLNDHSQFASRLESILTEIGTSQAQSMDLTAMTRLCHLTIDGEYDVDFNGWPHKLPLGRITSLQFRLLRVAPKAALLPNLKRLSLSFSEHFDSEWGWCGDLASCDSMKLFNVVIERLSMPKLETIILPLPDTKESCLTIAATRCGVIGVVDFLLMTLLMIFFFPPLSTEKFLNRDLDFQVSRSL